MREQLRGLLFLLASMVRAEPVRSVAALAIISAGRSATIVSAAGIRDLIDGAAAARDATVVRGAGLLAAGIALGLAARYPIATVGVTLRERASLAIEERLARLAATLPGIEHFERREYLDRIDLLRRGSFELGEAVGSIADTVAALVMLTATSLMVASVHPALLLVVVAALPSLAAAVVKERQLARFEEETAEYWRPKKDLRELVWTASNGPELRLFGAGKTVMRRQADACDVIYRRRVGRAWRSGGIQAVGDVLLAAGLTAAVAFIGGRVARGNAGPGDLALVVALCVQLGSQVTEVSESLRYIARLLRLVARMTFIAEQQHAPKAGDDARGVPSAFDRGIAIRDVSFRYEGTTRDVLHGVSLDIAPGTAVALVGENGAGKTTLVKLLYGFYQPTAGEMLVDGTPVSAFDPEEWRSRVASSFQDFARFEFIARESVGVGLLSDLHDLDAVRLGVERGDATELVARLPHGLATQLGPQFDGGVDLSGGEWQRVALARAAMRNEPLLLVLDEPTAALDPLAEQRLFDRVTSLVAARRDKGMIAIFVSHRFSTVRAADVIVVLDGGTIVERGSHAELMALNGQYASLYSRQAAGYR